MSGACALFIPPPKGEGGDLGLGPGEPGGGYSLCWKFKRRHPSPRLRAATPSPFGGGIK